MPKNKVNNNIKLKSGGGIINDATDGLKVNIGTTAGKIVALDDDAKLPAVSGENLTNLPGSCAFQTLTKISGEYPGPVSTAVDGSVLFIGVTAQNTSYNTVYIRRYKRDTKTGIYIETHHSSWNPGNSNGAFNMAVVNGYLYISRNQNASIYRMSAADLTGGTLMNISGGSMSAYTKYLIADPADPNSLYVFSDTTGYRLEKYSISGTTLTYVSYISCAPIGGDGAGTWADSSYFYIAKASNNTVFRINRSTGATTSKTIADHGISQVEWLDNTSLGRPWILTEIDGRVVMVTLNTSTYTNSWYWLTLTQHSPITF